MSRFAKSGGPRLTDDQYLNAVQAMREHKGNVSRAAASLGLARSTMQNRLKRAEALGLYQPDLQGEKKDVIAPLEVHDAAFWRSKYNGIELEAGRLRRALEEVAGVRSLPYREPDWLQTPEQGKTGRAVLGGLLSDVHDGEVVDEDEIQGVNAYDPDICAYRLNEYFEAAIVIGRRWSVDCEVQGFLLCLGGDMVSGDIHEELTRTNALVAHDQVQHCRDHIAKGISRLASEFGRVHVVSVPGNHGRTTRKPTAKLRADLSYDTLLAKMLADRFDGNRAITFQIGRGKDAVIPIFGRSILLTHFDAIGTRGGQGFAGPMLPILRGCKKLMEQQGSVSRHPDLILGGHYHTTGNPYLGQVPILANGSVIGSNEYSDDLRAPIEKPQQWTFLLHDRWWLRERQPIILTDLDAPVLPRVRVPAGWSK